VRGVPLALTLAGALIVAALGVGAWEVHRLDQSVQHLRAENQGSRTSSELDRAVRSLAALRKQTTKERESGLRLEFELPIQSALTQVVVAVESGNLACTTAKRRWENYVNNELIPYLNKPKQRDTKLAVQRDDSDYHATLLNDFNVAC
jgi:hypothetical protein